MRKCKHEWYPISVDRDKDSFLASVTRVCRLCWCYNVVLSKWEREP